ncbi:MAG: hypothetical protein ACR2QJ_06370 [Geminicoccaceae bacterium]
MTRNWFRTATAMALVQAALTTSAQAEQVAVDRSMLEQLQQIIDQQQEQLERQSGQLDSQAETIETLKSRVDQLEETSTESRELATDTEPSADQPVETAKTASPVEVPEKIVTSGSDKVKLAISGQINRAINLAGDGDDTKAYFVDNDTSNSRVRFEGTAAFDDDTTFGPTLEIALSPNNSFDVSQDNETSDDFTDVRKAEAFLRNDNYGRLLFGKGSAAADDTSEYDLSLVAGPIMYSGIADIVGGLQFTDGDDLSGVTVGDAFFNFDGNRQDRIRYDTPLFGPGAQVSLSAGSDQRYDAALTWGGDYGDWSGVDIADFTTLGALSIRDPDDDNVDWRLAGSFSTLHNPTGVSVTLSAGTDSLDGGDDPYNLYGKLGWDTKFFDVGPTGFGVDLTYTENVSGEGDDGTGLGLAAIQLIRDYGIELYAQFRTYDLDRDTGDSVDDIHVGTVGTRFKF